MTQVKLSFRERQAKFLNNYQAHGFKDKGALVVPPSITSRQPWKRKTWKNPPLSMRKSMLPTRISIP